MSRVQVRCRAREKARHPHLKSIETSSRTIGFTPSNAEGRYIIILNELSLRMPRESQGPVTWQNHLHWSCAQKSPGPHLDPSNLVAFFSIWLYPNYLQLCSPVIGYWKEYNCDKLLSVYKDPEKPKVLVISFLFTVLHLHNAGFPIPASQSVGPPL